MVWHICTFVLNVPACPHYIIHEVNIGEYNISVNNAVCSSSRARFMYIELVHTASAKMLSQ